jgi:hypothetical protein
VERVPIAIGFCFLRKNFELGLAWLDRKDFSAIAGAAEREAKLPAVGANIDDHRDGSILNEIDEIADSSPADVHDAQTAIGCSNAPIQGRGSFE